MCRLCWDADCCPPTRSMGTTRNRWRCSYKFWQQRFFSDPEVIGKTLQLDRKSYVIVGVAAPRFIWYSADVYMPLKLTQDPNQMCIVDFRLRPGVTHQAADSALQPLLESFAKEMPKHFPEHFKVQVEGLNEWVVRDMSGTLYLLFGAVALLLAIGCANVSILLLAQGAARQHEFAVRAAVGANSGRIMRQLLTESMLLAASAWCWVCWHPAEYCPVLSRSCPNSPSRRRSSFASIFQYSSSAAQWRWPRPFCSDCGHRFSCRGRRWAT